jgi:hypothetical protein
MARTVHKLSGLVLVRERGKVRALHGEALS